MINIKTLFCLIYLYIIISNEKYFYTNDEEKEQNYKILASKKIAQLKCARRGSSLKSNQSALLECEDSLGFPYFRVRISASREFL